MNNNLLGAVLVGAVALMDWVAVWRDSRRGEYILKPAVLVVLLAWFTLLTGWQGRMFWFGLALAFSLVGDVLLMFDAYFLAGLVAFLLTHVFYIIGLNPTSIPLEPLSMALTVLVWGAALLFFRRLSAAVRANEQTALLQYPVLFYSLAVSLMLLSALVTLARPEWAFGPAALVAAGGLLFFASDSLLAYDRFITHVPRSKFWVHLAYHLGQILLVCGVLWQYGG